MIKNYYSDNSLFVCVAPGYRQRLVNPEVALSNHYRVCEYGGTECVSRTSTVDRRAHAWGKDLLPAVNGKCNRVFGPDKGCPGPPAGGGVG